MSGKSRKKVKLDLQQSATATTPKNAASVEDDAYTVMLTKRNKIKKKTKKKPNANKRKKSTNIKTKAKTKPKTNAKMKKKTKPKAKKQKPKQKNISKTTNKSKKNSNKNKEKNMKVFNGLYSMKDGKAKKRNTKSTISEKAANHPPYTPKHMNSHSNMNRKPLHNSYTISLSTKAKTNTKSYFNTKTVPDHILTDEQIMLNALKDTQMVEQLFLKSRQISPKKKVSFASNVSDNSPSVSYPNPLKQKKSSKKRKNQQPKNTTVKNRIRSKSMDAKKRKMKNKNNKQITEKKSNEDADYSSIHSVSQTISNTMANAHLEENNNRFARFSLKFGQKKKHKPSESLTMKNINGEQQPKSYRFWHWRRNRSSNKPRLSLDINGGSSQSSDTDDQPSKLAESNKLKVNDRTLSKKILPKPPKRKMKKSKLKMKSKPISKSNDFKPKTKTKTKSTVNKKKKKNTKNVGKGKKNTPKKKSKLQKKRKNKENNTSLPLNLIKKVKAKNVFKTKKKKKKKILNNNNSMPVSKIFDKQNLKPPSIDKLPVSDSELELPHFQFHGRRKISKAKKFSNRIESNYSRKSSSDDIPKINRKRSRSVNTKKKKNKKQTKKKTTVKKLSISARNSVKKKRKPKTAKPSKPPRIQLQSNVRQKKKKCKKDLVTPFDDEPVFLNTDEKYDHYISHKNHQKHQKAMAEAAAAKEEMQMMNNNNPILRYINTDSTDISINNEDFDMMNNLTLEIAGMDKCFADNQSIKSGDSSGRNRTRAWRKKMRFSNMKKRSFESRSSSCSSYSISKRSKHSISDIKLAEKMNVSDVERYQSKFDINALAHLPKNINSNSNSYSYTTGTKVSSKRYMQNAVNSMPYDNSCYAIYAEFMKLDSEKKIQTNLSDSHTEGEFSEDMSMASSYFITGKRISQMQMQSEISSDTDSNDIQQIFGCTNGRMNGRKYGRVDVTVNPVMNGTHVRSSTEYGYYDRSQEEYEWQRERSFEFSNDYENMGIVNVNDDESCVYYDEEKEISYYGSTVGLSSIISSLPKVNEVPKNFIRSSFSSKNSSASSVSNKYQYKHNANVYDTHDVHSSNPNSSERLSQDLETFQYLHEIEITYESSDDGDKGDGDLLTDFDEESTLSIDDYGYQTD